MIDLYPSEIINIITIILCTIAMIKLIVKMKKVKELFKEEYQIRNLSIILKFALFIEALCVIMLIFNLILWQSIIVAVGILYIAFIIQHDKVLYIMCND